MLVATALALGACLTSPPAAPAEPLTLESCLELAHQRSPLLRASRARHEASLAHVQTVKALPYPVLSYDSDLQPKPFQFSREGESYLGVSQVLEFPGKRSRRGRIAAHEADMALADAARVRLLLDFEVKAAFAGLLLARERLLLARENLALAREFLEKTEHKYQAGDVAEVERLRAQVEASKAHNVEKAAANDVELARAELAFQIAWPPDSLLEVAGQLGRPPVPTDAETLERTALERRPEIRQLDLAQACQRLTERQARLEALPDLEVGAARHRIAGEATTWDVTLSVPVPLFFWQPRRGPIAESMASRRALEHEAEGLRHAIRLEVQKAYTNAQSARDRTRLFEDQILAQAREVYDMFLFSYQQGAIGGIELIEARRTLVEARAGYAEALYQHDLAIAALESAVGE